MHRLGGIGKLAKEEDGRRSGLFSQGRFDPPSLKRLRDTGLPPARQVPAAALVHAARGLSPAHPPPPGLRPGRAGQLVPRPAGARPGCQAGSFEESIFIIQIPRLRLPASGASQLFN